MITTLLLLINISRPPNFKLQTDKYLVTLAEQRCNSIKDFSHNDYYNIYSKQIEKKYKETGEVLALDFTTATDTVKAWLNSPSHKEILTAKRYTSVGFSSCKTKLGIVSVGEFGGK